MWIAKLELIRENSIVVSQTKHFDVVASSYYLNVYNKNGRAFVNKVMNVEGSDAQKFIDFFVKSNRRQINSVEGNQVFYEHEAIDTPHSQVLGSSVFLVGPIVAKNGVEHWTVASWSKKNIFDTVKKIKAMQGVKVKLIAIVEEQVNLFLPDLFAELTQNQLKTIQTAFVEGYYNIPRQTNVKKIAQKLGKTASTIHEHLLKAETKIIGLTITKTTPAT